ncbi:hypothetical protein KIL84_017674 [Mauremys mutica]|uniref:Uncharacterized protein n=1 Tax=Mauremys mutica TaxID=74926 RepID=A0A9D4AYV5_9SAUR|nr:hypothetical protein KIL84_017674 [Mauremys mutica]
MHVYKVCSSAAAAHIRPSHAPALRQAKATAKKRELEQIPWVLQLPAGRRLAPWHCRGGRQHPLGRASVATGPPSPLKEKGGRAGWGQTAPAPRARGQQRRCAPGSGGGGSSAQKRQGRDQSWLHLRPCSKQEASARPLLSRVPRLRPASPAWKPRTRCCLACPSGRDARRGGKQPPAQHRAVPAGVWGVEKGGEGGAARRAPPRGSQPLSGLSPPLHPDSFSQFPGLRLTGGGGGGEAEAAKNNQRAQRRRQPHMAGHTPSAHSQPNPPHSRAHVEGTREPAQTPSRERAGTRGGREPEPSPPPRRRDLGLKGVPTPVPLGDGERTRPPHPSHTQLRSPHSAEGRCSNDRRQVTGQRT